MMMTPLNSSKRPPYWNSTSGFHLRTSLQSTCHSVPVCEILSKSDHTRQNKMKSCRFSRWRISAILDCRDPIMGSLKSPCAISYRSSIDTVGPYSFWENRVLAFWRQDPRTRRSATLDFRGPLMGSLKSSCTTSCRSLIETIALNCLVFEKIAFFCILATDRQTNRQTDRQTDKQMDITDAWSRSLDVASCGLIIAHVSSDRCSWLCKVPYTYPVFLDSMKPFVVLHSRSQTTSSFVRPLGLSITDWKCRPGYTYYQTKITELTYVEGRSRSLAMAQFNTQHITSY